MKTHILKTDPGLIALRKAGKRPWEIRLNDRDFKVGDEIILQETCHSGDAMADGAPLAYTGKGLRCTITYMEMNIYGIKDGWVLMMTEVVEE